MAFVQKLEGSTALEPRTARAVHHAFGWVAYGGSGGDVLQGPAMVEIYTQLIYTSAGVATKKAKAHILGGHNAQYTA